MYYLIANNYLKCEYSNNYKINIKEIKFAETAVISKLKKPAKPIIINTHNGPL